MAKFDIKFIDIDDSKVSISVNSTNDNLIDIRIIDKNLGLSGVLMIELDKSTAIKFAKTLRTEINKITAREEGNNG